MGGTCSAVCATAAIAKGATAGAPGDTAPRETTPAAAAPPFAGSAATSAAASEAPRPPAAAWRRQRAKTRVFSINKGKGAVQACVCFSGWKGLPGNYKRKPLGFIMRASRRVEPLRESSEGIL